MPGGMSLIGQPWPNCIIRLTDNDIINYVLCLTGPVSSKGSILAKSRG